MTASFSSSFSQFTPLSHQCRYIRSTRTTTREGKKREAIITGCLQWEPSVSCSAAAVVTGRRLLPRLRPPIMVLQQIYTVYIYIYLSIQWREKKREKRGRRSVITIWNSKGTLARQLTAVRCACTQLATLHHHYDCDPTTTPRGIREKEHMRLRKDGGMAYHILLLFSHSLEIKEQMSFTASRSLIHHVSISFFWKKLPNFNQEGFRISFFMH